MPVKRTHLVVARSVSWLWPGFLPLGKLALLDGDPDLGKSLIALDLCARLSTARPFPDGRPSPGPANSLVLSAEDNAADTIVPRLMRLGADLQRVAVWERDHDDEDWPWRFPADVARLDAALAETEARLAVIDPVMAFLDDSVLCASDRSVRRALTPLMRLAEKHHCTLLMHRHLNKRGRGPALYRGLDSIAFVAACRFAMLVARDPQAPDRSVLAPVRHSLSGPQPSLAYRISAVEGELPVVEWLGASSITANELLAGAPRPKDAPRQTAMAFLREFLAGGPRSAREIFAAAQGGGYSYRTFRRARIDLNITRTIVNDGNGPLTYWQLPVQEPPGDPGSGTAGLERQFERWLEKNVDSKVQEEDEERDGDGEEE
jgi:hypothetical protein